MKNIFFMALYLFVFCAPVWGSGPVSTFKDFIYFPGKLKATDSQIKVRVGDAAPDFTLPAISGQMVKLSSYQGKANVVLSFVPAAWTPVCSAQWPGYNITKKLFQDNATILLGITVDNIPTLHAWTEQMGKLWFPVLSDFWPHGEVAEHYGILRGDGTSERALIFINKEGLITAVDVSDINVRPPLEFIVRELGRLSGK